MVVGVIFGGFLEYGFGVKFLDSRKGDDESGEAAVDELSWSLTGAVETAVV